MSEAVKEGRTYFHKRTGGGYVVQHLGLAKQGDGEWVACVMYVQEGTGAWFCRDLAMFLKNFVLAD